MKPSFDLKLIVFSIVLLRFLPFFFSHSPAGTDITLLGDMIRLYVESWQQGALVPTTMMPLFGQGRFFDFHSLSAPFLAAIEYFFPHTLLISLQIYSCLSFVLYDFSILYLLMVLSSPKAPQSSDFKSMDTRCLLIFFLVAYASPIPQRFMGSGGAAFVLSAAFTLFALGHFFRAIFVHQKDLRGTAKHTLFCALLFSASLSQHPIPVLGAPMLFLMILAIKAFCEGKNFPFHRWAIPGLFIIAFNLPILLSFPKPDPFLEGEAQKWITYVKSQYSFYFSPDHTFSSGFLGFLGYNLKQFAFLGPFLLLLLPLKRNFVYVLLALTLLSLFTWFGHYLPHAGLAIYPDRMAQNVVLLAGICLLICKSFGERGPFSRSQKVLVTLLFIMAFGRYGWNYLVQPTKNALITADDAALIYEYKDLLAQSNLIEIDQNDAGLWLPAMIGRPVSSPHVHYPHMKAWKAYQAELGRPQVRFVGTRCALAPGCKVSCDKDKIVASKGRSAICRL